MPSWCTWSTLYKGFFTLVVALILLEYLFGSIDSKSWDVRTNYNVTRHPHISRLTERMHNLIRKHISNNGSVSKIHNVTTPTSNHTKLAQKTSNADHNISNFISGIFDTNTLSSTEPDLSLRVNKSNTTILPPCPDDPPDLHTWAIIIICHQCLRKGLPGFINLCNAECACVYHTTPQPLLSFVLHPVLEGRINVVKNSVPTIYELEKRFKWLKPGGHGTPETCKADKKVAIIIPFRCRGEHLLIFLQHMHPFLSKQQLDYTIFIIEQDGNAPFNRALLMNIGYKEALKIRDFDCFIFHDVDLLPEDDRNLYNCPTQPRHMSVAIDVFRYKLPYRTIFGGVSAITTEHFQLLNGFSNSFWGWGGEDDDMSNRISYHNLHISRYPQTIARYTMLTHKKDKPSPHRYENLKAGQKKFDTDGLNSLKYTTKQTKEHILYTWILVSIEPPS